ncbi:DUF1542 domain-containing protein [Corynebacterium sp. CCM 9185]|uniref:DUF1542 domain-containing protein n=1 Tax=Corynebacterium marambiense TaxID=2765364 RepID=A0ABS0VYL6_9CORY|nr:DUF1542 domain-containing protein [Corynebacterium marambiense]MBI9001444.1 DUF1542 domain-containing protein [Corynebacterium marambiense]MCK7664031.1 DUF1542 domain-containing protein [Corynebacterium marambiense]MCX7543366.1 DUF1542 domain-containing protein [Corynebacterium marambiense]
MNALLLIAIVIVIAVFLLSRYGSGGHRRSTASELDDAVADARRWIERLGSQVLSLSGSDTASTQALADASERYNAASGQISTAQTIRQAELARESALEGLHYVNAAREIMGMPAGPELPLLEGQRRAGSVTEQRTIDHEGKQITASPTASPETPNYYPGGMVAGRPVPAGWYSEPWWAGALRTGMWTAGSVMMFSMLFGGMSGIHYGPQEFEQGYGDTGADGVDGSAGDTGQGLGDADPGAGGDGGGFFGGDGGGMDFGGFDF